LPFLKEKDLSVINHLNYFPDLRHLLPNCRDPPVLSDSLPLRPPDNPRQLAAIQTGMKGFPASFPAVCTQKGTPSQIDSEKECLEGFWNWDVRFTLYCHLLRCTVI